MLTDGIRSLDDLAPDDARRGLPRFTPEAFTANRRLVAQIEEIATRLGISVAQMALAWVMAEGVVPIPGTRRRARLDENASAADVALDPEIRQALTDALPVSEIVGSRDGIDAPRGTDR